MEFLIVSGLSGAGKSRAADVLEDLDFYCVDNMPVALLDKFAEFCKGMSGRYERVALVTDIRDREGIEGILPAIQKLSELGCDCRVLFIEADLATIVKRYKETRRPHPLQDEAGSLEAAVRLEMDRMALLREAADYTINTASLTLGMLQAKIYKLFVDEGDKRGISVNVMSFGFKYGLPIEADMVLDVRFLPNPYYIPELRKKTGMDKEVFDFVFEHDTTREFISRLKEMISFLLPNYIEEGKHSLTIAIGCTGGRHRSVAVARYLTDYIRELGQSAELVNRDCDR
ncbi:MAG: RNase adapter RapZ [Oscillospiraceae bacterium]|nr:RNase adapter RapZ [Oscillospiraceae bacterium]MBR5261189.1 RNase adapter RapZ [Oscillospiraceae bacterium]